MASFRTNFHRNLVCCTTHTSCFYFKNRHDVIHSFLECFKCVLTCLFCYDIECIINYFLSNTLFTVKHNVVYKLCYEKFFNAPRHISLLCTIGISMLIKNLAQIVFGPETKPVLDIVENKTFTLMLGSVRLDIKLLQIVVIVLVVVLASALTLFFNKTKWGIALRAVSQNKDAAYLVGINVKRTAMIGNCIGSGFGGIAGILLCIYYYSVSATMGGIYSMKAFAASVLGGLVDIRFSALGGLCIGVIENLGIAISAATFRDVFAFGFLILVLLIRPQGFVSKKGVRV